MSQFCGTEFNCILFSTSFHVCNPLEILNAVEEIVTIDHNFRNILLVVIETGYVYGIQISLQQGCCQQLRTVLRNEIVLNSHWITAKTVCVIIRSQMW